MEPQQEKELISFRDTRNSKEVYKPFIYSLILAFGVMIGFVVNTITSGKQNLMQSGSYDKINDIINFIDMKYVDTVNREELVDKTIDKLLSNLDPHSVYIPAKDLTEANESLEGNFEGIGIEFFIVQDTITVVTSISGGPAENAGIQAGDRIIKINDSLAAGIKIKENDVKKKLRGPAGSKVTVSVLRSGAKNLLQFPITRGKIPLFSIDAAYMLNAATGYIRISNFGATTHQEFNERMNRFIEQGMKKLVLDLRGNPGGYLQAATTIADELIGGSDMIVYTQGKAYDKQEYHASKPGLFERGDICVLIDQGSASASEILAGAIQDLDRGTIIGRTSFGKGLVQEPLELKDGSNVRLTIARYYTPSGRCIQRTYDKGSDDYYNEMYERYMRGEFVHEDSLKNEDTAHYTTKKGRVVHGGGGIRPDVFVPMDTSAENDYFFSVRTFVPEFVYKYSSQHPELLKKYRNQEDFNNSFEVNEVLIQDFYAYAASAGLKRSLDNESKIAQKLKLQLKAFLAKQTWRTEGYFYIINQDDKVVKTALEQLSVSTKK
jgi:carboxyl-terminal processing protease